jgi:hypothetical protein
VTESFTPDELVEDGEKYFYRNGRWCNEAGMCVSLTRSQQMTMTFYQEHGRSPRLEPKKKKKRTTKKAKAKAEKAKADKVRAALKKAQAKQASSD